MRRGTTPTHIFKVPIDLTEAAEIYITYKQDGEIKLEKNIGDMTITAEDITVELSQTETLAFSTIGEVEIQCRARFPDGSAVASCIKKIPVCKILKEGVI